MLLDNAAHDPSYLCEAVGGQLFREAGVPAARCTFARLEVNGKDCGLFIVVEAANRDFLSAAFKKSKGNLYEGSNVDINEKLEKDSGDPTTDQSDLRALAAAVKEPDPAQRMKKLSALLDLGRFITFAACEVFLDHHDGYCQRKDNENDAHAAASIVVARDSSTASPVPDLVPASSKVLPSQLPSTTVSELAGIMMAAMSGLMIPVIARTAPSRL